MDAARVGIGALIRAIFGSHSFTPELEAIFLDEYGRRYAPRRRIGVLIALLLWTAYIVFDTFDDGLDNVEKRSTALAFRAFGLIALLAGVGFSLTKRFERNGFAQPIIATLFFVIFFVTLRISLLTMTVGNLTFEALFPPLLILIGFFKIVGRALNILLLLCLLSSIWLTPLFYSYISVGSTSYLGSVFNITYLLNFENLAAFLAAGAFIAGELERGDRNAFVRERDLAKKNDELVDSSKALEATSRQVIAAREELAQQAQQASRDKSKFLADAAHDLRQPLHAASLLIESAKHALSRGDLSKGTELVDSAGRAAQNAQSSFRAILDISQLESGLLSPSYSIFNLIDLVSEVLSSFEIIAEEKGVSLRLVTSSGRGAFVRTDYTICSRIVANLVSNAIKYSSPIIGKKRIILIGFLRVAEKVRIQVFDNGIGIPEDKRQLIFDPFVQLNNPMRDREHGLGLGLSIVSASVSLLTGHEIEVASVEGKWTRFSLFLPRHEDQLIDSDISGAEGNMRNSLEEIFLWYVEDEPIVLEATLLLFEELGVLVEHATSIAEIREKLSYTERRPDVIVTVSPLDDGSKADEIAEVFYGKWKLEIPMLVVSDGAHGQHGALDGNSIFLGKPVSAKALVQAIKQLTFLGTGAAVAG